MREWKILSAYRGQLIETKLNELEENFNVTVISTTSNENRLYVTVLLEEKNKHDTLFS